jgi:FkbM family methyltransferase
MDLALAARLRLDRGREGVASALGLGRSLAMYYARPWRQRALRRFYAAHVGSGDLAFDIGAHVGNRTRALRACGAEVVAVEPQALFHAFLARTLPRAGVHLRRCAVGAAAGEITLKVSRRHPTVSSAAPGWPLQVAKDPGFQHVRWDGAERVPMLTLDDLIAAHGRPRFCKIDVEGMESAILAGLSQPIPLIAFEYLPASLEVAEACLDRLAALGPYEVNVIQGEAAVFRWPDWTAPAAAKAPLRELAADGRSGDVYARLRA